jgi:transcriptional regulator with XRE-family HTH domain
MLDRDYSTADKQCGHLRQFRKERGFTLKELAKIMRTTPQTVQRLETGNMTVSLDWLDKFAEALNVPREKLVYSGISPETPDERFIELIRAEAMKARRYLASEQNAWLALAEAMGKLAGGLIERQRGLRRPDEIAQLAAAVSAAAMIISVDGESKCAS